MSHGALLGPFLRSPPISSPIPNPCAMVPHHGRLLAPLSVATVKEASFSVVGVPSSPRFMPSRKRTSSHFFTCSSHLSIVLFITTHRYDHDFIVHLLRLSSPSLVQTICSGCLPLHHLDGTLPIFDFRVQIENSRYKPRSTTSFPPHLSIARWLPLLRVVGTPHMQLVLIYIDNSYRSAI